MLPSLDEIEAAAHIVYDHMPPTPQYRWEMLNQRLDVDLWLKHENHTPLGAFKVRGGLVYFDRLGETPELKRGVICATRGNHGQSVAYAAAKYGIPTTIVVPFGNSKEKNEAMISLGANLVEAGNDFQDAFEHATMLAEKKSLHLVASFHPLLIQGVATYSLELFRAAQQLDVVYVPIGQGSGICGAISVRNALKLSTEIVGVVSAEAAAYSKSFEAKVPIEVLANTRIADGMACRRPNEQALEQILTNVDRIVEVTDNEVEQAMRDLFECTHNVAEGAGAAAVAAVAKESKDLKGKTVAAILCGGNVDRSVFASILIAG